jgi:hypothetical protein
MGLRRVFIRTILQALTARNALFEKCHSRMFVPSPPALSGACAEAVESPAKTRKIGNDWARSL